MLSSPAVIIAMPATRRASESPAAEPYSLVGAPKSQLAALTVTALKSHLQHYRLPTTGKKAALVDRLYNHICSLSEGAAGSNPTASTHGSQAGNCTTQLTTSSTQSTHSTTQSANPSTLPLPQQLLDQLTAYLQQYQTPPVGIQASNSGNITDDDNLSVASGPTHTTVSVPAQVVTSLPVVTSITTTLSDAMLPAVTRTPLPATIPAVTILPPPANLSRSPLPVIPTRFKNKIARGEYIDFATLLPKAMFGTSNPLSQQSVTIQLNPDGYSFAIQQVPIASNSSAKIPSFATWMEA